MKFSHLKRALRLVPVGRLVIALLLNLLSWPRLLVGLASAPRRCASPGHLRCPR
jgi:hypothetical protein